MQFLDIFDTCFTLHASPSSNVNFSERRSLILTEIRTVVTRVSTGCTVHHRTVVAFHRDTSRAFVAFVA